VVDSPVNPAVDNLVADSPMVDSPAANSPVVDSPVNPAVDSRATIRSPVGHLMVFPELVTRSPLETVLLVVPVARDRAAASRTPKTRVAEHLVKAMTEPDFPATTASMTTCPAVVSRMVSNPAVKDPTAKCPVVRQVVTTTCPTWVMTSTMIHRPTAATPTTCPRIPVTVTLTTT